MGRKRQNEIYCCAEALVGITAGFGGVGFPTGGLAENLFCGCWGALG